jgi:hypothetical protein
MAGAAHVPVMVLAPRACVVPESATLDGLLPRGGAPAADIVPSSLINSMISESLS